MDRIERQIDIDAPVDRVWTMVTEAEHLGTWFGDAGAEIDLRPGGALTVRWQPGHVLTGVVEAVEPTTRFAFRWLLTDFVATPDPASSTLVEFTLAPTDTGTRVSVVESGFTALALSEADQRARFDSHTGGWPVELGHLAEHAVRVAA
jgi:uncharacterized protein YndB with AHSA1/START domain